MRPLIQMSNIMKCKILIAPSKSNKKEHIQQKYKILSNELKKQNIDCCDLILKYFSLKLLFTKNQIIYVRESVVLYPFLLLITLFHKKYILEVNGNPVADSNAPYFIKKVLFKFRKIILEKNKKLKVIAFSYDEIVNYNIRNKIVSNNFFDYNFRKSKLPRSKNILMLIGTNANWHGIDRVVEFAKTLTEYNFYIFGLDESRKIDKPKNIEFFPYESISSILDKKQFGYAIGSFDYFKKIGKIKQNSSLKGVLYHLVDLPYVQSFEEINSVDKFVLTLSSSDMVNLTVTKNKVISFFDVWRDRNLEINDVLHFSPAFFTQHILN